MAAKDKTAETAASEAAKSNGDGSVEGELTEQLGIEVGDSPYSLEPNLKEAPGGLRDLQVIQWIARASGMGRKWSELVPHKLIERGEARQLSRLERHLHDLRIRLHYLAGRREDRIVFDQDLDTVAEESGKHRRKAAVHDD